MNHRITDMRVPGPVSAVSLCRHFTPVCVKVMVVTGVGPGDEQTAVKAAGCGVLAMKPLTTDTLCEHVPRIAAGVR